MPEMPELTLQLSRETLHELLENMAAAKLSERAREELCTAAMQPAYTPDSLCALRRLYAECVASTDSADATVEKRLERLAEQLQRFVSDTEEKHCVNMVTYSDEDGRREWFLSCGQDFFRGWKDDVHDMALLRSFIRNLPDTIYRDMCDASLLYPGVTDPFALVDACMFVMWHGGYNIDYIGTWHALNWSKKREWLKSDSKWSAMVEYSQDPAELQADCEATEGSDE